MAMSRIAVLITDMFEDVEYTKPAEAFRKGGHDLVHVGLSAGETVHGKKGLAEVTIDRAASGVSRPWSSCVSSSRAANRSSPYAMRPSS
jgi:protease I